MFIKKKLTDISAPAIFIVLLFAVAMTYLISLSFAASGTASMYTSPGGNQAVTLGNEFEVNTQIATGPNVPVTGAEAYMAYPADKIQVVSVSYGGSPYNIQLEESNSGGVLKMVRAAFPVIPGGDRLFARVTFKAIASGTAEINFSANSKVISGEDDTNILATRNGVNYTIAGAAATPSPAPAPSTTAPIGAGSFSTRPATNSPPTSARTPTSTSTSTQPQTNTTGQPSEVPQPTESANQNRYSVDVLATDSNKKPIEGAKVSLYHQTSMSGKDGMTHFVDVPVGTHQLKIEYRARSIEKTINILPLVETNKPQFFTAEIKANSGFNPIYGLLPLVIAASLAALYFGRTRFIHKEATHAPELFQKEKPQPQPSASNATNTFHPVSAAISVPIEKPGQVVKPQSENNSTLPPA